jgi:hypothetical protein
MKPDAEWVWSADCQCGFQFIEDKVASKPMLAHFDIAPSTIVTFFLGRAPRSAKTVSNIPWHLLLEC